MIYMKTAASFVWHKLVPVIAAAVALAWAFIKAI